MVTVPAQVPVWSTMERKAYAGTAQSLGPADKIVCMCPLQRCCTVTGSTHMTGTQQGRLRATEVVWISGATTGSVPTATCWQHYRQHLGC